AITCCARQGETRHRMRCGALKEQPHLRTTRSNAASTGFNIRMRINCESHARTGHWCHRIDRMGEAPRLRRGLLLIDQCATYRLTCTLFPPAAPGPPKPEPPP